MGRTNRTYRDVLQAIEERWVDFQRIDEVLREGRRRG
jgi:predicted DNA-binding ArsR family transcriptional regulator